MEKIHHPHDGAAKIALRDVRVAREVFMHYLPGEIKNKIDLDHLLLQNGSFHDENLKETSTDVLYQTRTINGEKGYLYLLLEAQQKPDKWMAFRLWKYITRILDQHLSQHENNQYLPLVVPLVLYMGKEKYSYSMEVSDLFGQQSGLAKETLMGPYPRIDLLTIPDQTLHQHAWSGLFELIVKHAGQRNTLKLLEEIVEHFLDRLKNMPHTDIYVGGMLNYFIDQADIPDASRFIRIIKGHLTPEVEAEMMTIAKRWQLEGMQQGMQQGDELGRMDVAKEMLLDGFDEDKVVKLTHLPREVVYKLKEQVILL
jgi:predicted transposase/invertase (TIGR01784 family)